MNIDMTRAEKQTNICLDCARCLHYHGEGIYCLGDKAKCWNWAYDREKDPCDPAYLPFWMREDRATHNPNEDELLGMINDLAHQNLNLMKMMQYREEQNETIQSND